MPGFWRYRPLQLSLAPEAPIVRVPLDSRVRIDGRGRLDAADLRHFDATSLFHDVFVADDAVVAIGPPPVNLAGALGRFELRVGALGADASRSLRARRRDHPRASVWRAPVPAALAGHDAIEVEIGFANGPRLRCVVRRRVLPPVDLQFATLQKDNEPRWIVDWLRHARVLGATRVLFYDNASAEADELAATLAERVREDASMPDLVFVDWPWPFGTRRNHANKFTKATHANHAHLRFGQARWTGHFDIDEYPVTGPGDAAPGAVARVLAAQSPRTGAVRIDSWWVPRTAGVPWPWTARDFPLRERLPRGSARKLFVRTEAVSDVRTHSVRLRLGWWRRTLAPDRLGFLHYKALTTGWKAHDDRLDAVASRPASLVEDRRVIESLAAARTPPPLRGGDGPGGPTGACTPGRSRSPAPDCRTS